MANCQKSNEEVPEILIIGDKTLNYFGEYMRKSHTKDINRRIGLAWSAEANIGN